MRICESSSKLVVGVAAAMLLAMGRPPKPAPIPGLDDVKIDDFDHDMVQDAVMKGYMRGCLREAQNQLVNLGLFDSWELDQSTQTLRTRH